MFEHVTPNARMSADPKAEGIRVTAYVNRAGPDRQIVQHAFALAQALNAPLTILQVLQHERGVLRPDPIEWDIRRDEAHRSLEELAAAFEPSVNRAKTHLAEGSTIEAISQFLADRSDELLVVGMPQSQGLDRGIGSLIHDLLHAVSVPMLLVPPASAINPGVVPSYRRILVPIDGSAWAASALPTATRLAKANGAELILAHVVPTPELTEIAPYSAADLELRDRVLERNRRAVCDYLERMRRSLADLGINARAICIHGDDVRETLASIIKAEGVDLVILSPRGHGLSTNVEMPYGSVAGYLMMHSPAPLLLVRSPVSCSRHDVDRRTAELRFPLIASA